MRLFTKKELETELCEPWMQKAATAFNCRMTDRSRPFPCIPATQGARLEQFRYGFVTREEDQTDQLAFLLSKYIKDAHECGPYTSLIVFFEPFRDESTWNVDQYEQFFWSVLKQTSLRDTSDYPSDLPSDPHNPVWEYAFGRERLFMYCATPAHTQRRSRYFPYFMLAITPRWVLEEFHRHHRHPEKIKEKIRDRLVAFDEAPVHPDLNTYGSEKNFEWRQYFLRDDNSRLDQCPFHTAHIGKNESQNP